MGAGRARWLAVFVVLLCASCAAPVLAESPNIGVSPVRVADAPMRTAEAPAPSEEEVPPPAETEPPAPGPIAEEVEAVESEEAARDEWLDSPEAIRQREESRTAFDDLTAVDAEGVLGSVFEEALKQLDGDPARALSDMQIEEVVSENGALVADGEGGMELVESPIPIRSKVPGEEGKAVDLDLKESEGGFESKSPATDIRLPASLGGQVEVGEELAFATLPGNGEVAATRFGDKDLFYPNTDTDTDTFIAPLARSVEIFQQLRSPKSPEQFRYGLTLPQDTTLRPDGEGGAEAVNSKGERVASVPAPFAIDAQGTKVPVSMAIEGDSVVVEIAHRSMDAAYPLLLDPELVNDAWYWEGNGPSGLEYWGWSETADYENGNWCTLSCWGWGLYARSKGSNYWYGGNTYGQWIYTAPNSTAYIAAATFWTIKGNSYNCITNQPHGYVGIYNVYSGSYNSLGIWSPPSGYSSEFQTGWVGGNGTRLAVVGIGTGSSPSQLACGHDFYVAGALLNQDDPENPGVSASGMPSGWVSDATPAFTINSNGSDPGLGVRKTTFTRDGQPTIERPVGCNGTAGSRCPVNRNEQFNVSALSFDEGMKNAAITVEDVTGKKSTQTWQTYIDMTQPDVTLSGQLAVATDEDEGEEQGNKEVEELSLPVYNLDIKATDVGTEQNADHKKRSGVRKIEVLLDGVKKQEWTQPCSDSCSMEKTYPLKLNNLSADKHVLKVIAIDGVEKKREREIEFEYIPATGMKDEYVMQYFPLPDGEGNEAEEERPDRPELAVNVMNGNLVYREKDVDVEGYSVDLEVERYYNSLLPEQENTEWGDGWTLAQTPDFEPEETEGSEPPAKAMMVRTSGAVEGSVALPASVGTQKFDPELRAVITKESGGGYEVADATGESDTAVAFDEEGKVEELRTEGLAKVNYDYEGGHLTEIAVEDPGTTGLLPSEVEKPPFEPGPYTGVLYAEAFGEGGSAAGQLKLPADVAVDAAGDLWVIDRENARVQKFSPKGELLDSFGSEGTADGQFIWPSCLAIDPEGNIWVTDSANHRVQKFNAQGEFLSKFGSYGTGNGQFNGSAGIAISPTGNAIFVTDRGNHRIQRFTKEGAYFGQVGGYGWEDTKFDEPVALAIGAPWGEFAYTVFVVDSGNNRVKRYTPLGGFISKFGSYGTGDGQLDSPANVEIDPKGYVWVGDRRNARVQLFDQDGTYIDQFGAKGSEEGQFDFAYPMGIASDGAGGIWVTDGNHNRLQKWVVGSYVPNEDPLPADDPSLAVATTSGLINSVEGEEAGEHDYVHSGGLLTAHEGPQGKSSYEYDSAGRMTKVTLSNGTWAQIEYGATDGRVKKVTVDPVGSAPGKSTTFTYADQPRSTKVILPDAPAVTYDIGEDGSVFKWQNALKPPEFEVVSGTLYDVENKETATPIAVGDYNLVVKAYSEEGIASIQVYANGDQLISEKTCPQIDEEPEACKKLPDEWVTNTGNHAPGILNLEIFIEDGIEQVASKRFWVNMPYTPPPPPDQPVTPKFSEVLEFRERRGLDLDLDPVQDELELNDRVFDTINDWIQGRPVAVASMERWGAPLRTPEVAELEYREQYINYNTPLIEDWGEAHASTFAGYVIDEAAGGIIRVRFTSNPAGHLSELKQQVPLMAQDRFGSQIAPNGYSLASLQQLVGSLSSEQENNSNLSASIVSVAIDIRRNLIRVGGPNTSQLAATLQSLYGANSPFAVEYAPGGVSLSGQLMAGENLRTRYYDFEFESTEFTECTTGFGAFRKVKKKDGSWGRIPFLLTAGHCSDVGKPVQKFKYPHGTDNYFGIGHVAKSSWQGWNKWETDALAVKLEGLPAPDRIFWQGSPSASRRVTPMGRSHPGDELCFSGVVSNFPKCGEAHEVEERSPIYRHGVQHGRQWNIPISVGCEPGDSGAPVWSKTTGRVVGLLVEKESSRNFPDFWNTTTACFAAPLMNPKGVPTGQGPGVFGAPAFEGLHLKEAP